MTGAEMFEVICVLARLVFIQGFTIWISVILTIWVWKMLIKGIFD